MITIFVLIALTGLTIANPLDLQPREDVKEDHFDLCRLLGCHRPPTVTRTLVYTITSTATSLATATATITTTLDCSPSSSTTLRTTATTSDFTSTETSATTATSPDTTASIDTTSTDTAAPTDLTTSTDTTSADTTAALTTLTDASSTDINSSTGATTLNGATTSTAMTMSTNTTSTGVTTSSDITIPTYTASTTDVTTSADTVTSTEAATSGTTTAEATDTTTPPETPTTAASTSSSSSSSASTTGLLSPLSTLVPFNCSADPYFIQDRTLFSVNLQTGEKKTLCSRLGGSSARVNAIGFNPLDNFIYGLQNKTVVRIGHDGALQPVVQGDVAANAGDIDADGQFYYSAGGRAWAQVDLKPGSARYGQVVARGTSDSSALPGNLAAADWAFTPAAPGYLHSVAVDADDVVYLVRWDVASHRWEVRHKGLPSFGIRGGVFGAVVATSDAVLYASQIRSGAVLRIPLDDPEGTGEKALVSRAGFSDGCRCASRPDVAV